MASEMGKNAKVADDQEVTSQERDQSGGTKVDGEDQVASLARQSSILSLTLEELQNSFCEPGRNFGSMNMDEFVANIWNAEEFQAATGGCKGAMEETKVVGVGSEGGDAGGSGLCRQGSFSLPLPLCQKTVEEVWAEINQGPAHTSAEVPAQQLVQPRAGSGGIAADGRRVTLGEMTLEDFLVKAGVVRGSFTGQGRTTMGAGMIHGPVNPMQQGQAGPMMFPVGPANAMYPVMGDGMGYPNGYNGMAVVPPPPPSHGAMAAVSPGSSDGMSAMTHADMMNCIGNGMVIENGTRKRPHREDGSLEKTVERRQRRMIKNRESAARSRARKQAYTVELEAELDYLKQENARLRDAEKTILLTKKQMLVEKMMAESKERMNAKEGSSRLRRTGSCMW
uniref:BZIP domain-containing protein n=1 Tax=Leersia perrieri TaxID=77586 RepID=A0A0D9V813_9ORYZ